MSDRSITFLKDRRTGELVEAALIDGVSRQEVESTESAWRPFLMNSLEERRRAGNSELSPPEHSHWDWRRKHEAVRGLIAYRMFGVECDGATYHRAATARDRDKLRQLILEGLGWTLYRVWSTDWWHDSEAETKKLLSFIQELSKQT